MKLPKTAWKNAWHDRKLSDQFFREWGKLDKSPAHELPSSGAWMSQIAIEVGQLAQSMIHLEEPAVHPAHLRLAQDMALKVAVHAAKLASSLTVAMAEQDDAFSSVVRKTAQAVESHGTAEPAVQRELGPSPVTHRGASHLPPLPGEFASHGGAPATLHHVIQQQAIQQHAMPEQAMPQHAMPQRAMPQPAMPQPAPRQQGMVRPSAATAPAMTPAVDETPEYRRERPMEQTIVSLYGRGLSVEEIELVTGQPPQLIESILKAEPA